MPIRLLFFGTSAFAVPLLEALAADERFLVVGVVTQPDRPVGRKAILTPPPIKPVAEQLSIPLFQFENIKAPEAFTTLSSLAFEAAAVVSYGQIIPQQILDLAPNKFINLHGSILPAYRGASPIAEAIKQGERFTGTTVMLMDAKMDHGPILMSEQLAIGPRETTETLSERLAQLSTSFFGNAIVEYLQGTLKPTEQNHEQATFCSLLKREDGLINWEKSAKEIDCLIRAYTPWPGTKTVWQGKTVKIIAAHLGTSTNKPAGTFFLENQQLAVACGDKTSLVIDQVQPEGKSVMSGVAFANGQRIS